MTAEKVIEIKNLNWKYGDESVLKGIDLDIYKGNFYSIIGPNGSGKTTVIKSISKILDINSNIVYIKGRDIYNINNRELSKTLSTVPQNTGIEFDFTVEDIVLMGRAPYLKRFQSEDEEDIDLAREAMISTNIYGMKDKSIKEISGGERQRAIIARAITQDTDIVLLDEPVSSIDIKHQIEILDTISRLKSDKQLTVISILHDLNLASEYSDQIILLKDGEVFDFGSVNHVLTRDNIERVYGIQVDIYENPKTKNPYIVPIYNQF